MSRFWASGTDNRHHSHGWNASRAGDRRQWEGFVQRYVREARLPSLAP